MTYKEPHAAELHEHHVVIRGLRIHYWGRSATAFAAAPPVVLVHGLGVSSRYLLPTARELAPLFPVFAPDLPGFGASDRPNHALNVEELADTLAAWMDAVGLEHAALLGNSMGTQVAAECAARHPQHVARLVLLGPTIDRDARSMPVQMFRLALAALQEPASAWSLVLQDYLHCGPVRLLQTCMHALAHRMEDTLPRVEAPVLIVRGEHDPLAPPRWVEELLDRCRDGRLLVMPHAGHIPHYSAPRQFALAIVPFLSEARKERNRGREATYRQTLSAVCGDGR